MRTDGIAINDGATDEQEFGVSAPIFDHDGALAAVLTLSAPRARVSDELRARMSQVAITSAERISRSLGWLGPTSQD